ncbi:E3 UFM1-protein ligase 1 [Cryptosporidium tyzzeri]|nr:E3 UFM1-protein ligase 1 [Cryptosporidium tyzzeri]
MDVELNDLFKELERVQKHEINKNKINERTCIEILYKLIKKKGLNLITSLDGETFYTHKYLLNNIQNLLESKGRISIHDISKKMKISIEVILKLVKDMEKDNNNYIFYKSDIMTRKYVDDIFYDLNQELQDLHIVGLMKISEKTDLSIEFIKEEIKKRVNNGESEIKGNIVFETNNNPLMISNTYYKIIEYMIKGALLVAKKPLYFDEIIDIKIQDISIIIQSTKNLIEKNWIKGFIYENKIYIPDIFIKEEILFLINYFKNNGFLEIEKIKGILRYSNSNLEIKNQRITEWSKLHLSDNIIIIDDLFIINTNKVEIIRDNILHSCFELNPGYIYINHLLPYILTSEINKNYHFDIIKLIYKLNNHPVEIKSNDWLFVTFDGPESLYITNLDRSYFKIQFKFESNDIKNNFEELQDISIKKFQFNSRKHIFNNNFNALLFITNFNLVINSRIICKFQDFVFSKLENIINSMILPYFQLLPIPSSEFKPIKSNEKQKNKQIHNFINELVSKNNIKDLFLSEFKQDWNEIINDNPNNIEIFSSMSYSNNVQANEDDFQDLLWHLIIYSIAPFIVYIYNRRMKFVYDPSNVSRTFHIEKD